MCKTITALPDGMFRQRVAFCSKDGSADSTLTNVTFYLNRPIQKVIAINWIYNTVYGQATQTAGGTLLPLYVLAVDEFENENITTAGAGYWKMLGNTNNKTSEIAPPTVQEEKSYTTLNFHLKDVFATNTQLQNWMIEIEFICNN